MALALYHAVLSWHQHSSKGYCSCTVPIRCTTGHVIRRVLLWYASRTLFTWSRKISSVSPFAFPVREVLLGTAGSFVFRPELNVWQVPELADWYSSQFLLKMRDIQIMQESQRNTVLSLVIWTFCTTVSACSQHSIHSYTKEVGVLLQQMSNVRPYFLAETHIKSMELVKTLFKMTLTFAATN